MCPCPSQQHRLPHCEFLLRYCEKCPDISIPRQETNKDATNTCSTIHFRVYKNVFWCNIHIIFPYEEQTICYMRSTHISYVTPGKVYIQKDFVLIETLI